MRKWSSTNCNKLRHLTHNLRKVCVDQPKWDKQSLQGCFCITWGGAGAAENHGKYNLHQFPMCLTTFHEHIPVTQRFQGFWYLSWTGQAHKGRSVWALATSSRSSTSSEKNRWSASSKSTSSSTSKHKLNQQQKRTVGLSAAIGSIRTKNYAICTVQKFPTVFMSKKTQLKTHHKITGLILAPRGTAHPDLPRSRPVQGDFFLFHVCQRFSVNHPFFPLCTPPGRIRSGSIRLVLHSARRFNIEHDSFWKARSSRKNISKTWILKLTTRRGQELKRINSYVGVSFVRNFDFAHFPLARPVGQK